MPYEIRETDGRFCIFKEGDSSPMRQGDSEMCHASRADAEAQMAALYASEQGAGKSLADALAESDRQAGEMLFYRGGEIKALGDGRIGGYLVRFGDPKDTDLEGDYFTAATDFGPHKTTAVYYEHGLDERVATRVLDDDATLKADDFGIWVEAQLARRDEYEQFISEMIGKSKAGWSSGTAAHLVERERKRNSYFIKRWPLGLDASVTLTPAEPRNVVLTVKSFEDARRLKAEAEAGPIDPAPGAREPAESGDGTKTVQETSEENQMAEELNEIVAGPADELKARIEAIEKENAVLKAAIQAPADNPGAKLVAVKKVTDRGFKDDEVKSFLHWIRTGDDKPYKAAMQGQTDSEGGYAVPDDFYNQIVAKRNESSIIRQIGITRIPTGLDKVLVPAEGTAATKFVVTAEEAGYDENEPTLGQVAISVYKLTKLIKISEELEQDAKANFGGWLAEVWGRAMALAENYYLVATGTGTAQPQAMLVGATSSAITTAGATAITAAELMSLVYKMPAAYADNMVLIMQRATLASLAALTGNPFAFQPTPAGNVSPGTNPGTLLGVPVYCTDEMPAMTATLKSVLVANPALYGVAEREGLSVSRNPWLYQANGQIGLFAKYRLGGAVLQAEALYYLTQHA